MAIDQRFEACVAHLVGAAQAWNQGPHPDNLVKAIRELSEYHYARVTELLNEIGLLEDELSDR